MSFQPSARLRFTPNADKAVEVILWLATNCPGVDVYRLVKAAYFAEVWHLNEYGRPVVGDEYRAAQYGPLPQTIYGLLRHDPIEVLAAAPNGRLPFRLHNETQVETDRGPNLHRLSESDIEALQHGLAMVRDKSFDELVEITHDDPAYVNASGGLIDYRDLLDSRDPEHNEKAEDLAEIARYAVV